MNSNFTSKVVESGIVQKFQLYEVFEPDKPNLSEYNLTPIIKAFYVLMFLLAETIGNFLLFSLIIYEKYGMDSKKRTLTNQLLSSICGCRMMYNIFISPIVTIQHVFGHPYSKELCYFLKNFKLPKQKILKGKAKKYIIVFLISIHN